MTRNEYLVSELRYMAGLPYYSTRREFLNQVADSLETLKSITEDEAAIRRIANPEPRTDLCRATKI